MAATTDVTEMFKYTYGTDRLLYLAPLEIVAWRILSRKKKRVGGRGQWILPVQTRNTGVLVGHSEGGAISTRRSQPDTTEASFSLQEFHGVWDITWKMLRQAARDEDAFARGIDFMDSSFRRRVFRLLNAEILGAGRGELAFLPAADDQTQVTVSALPLMDLGLIIDLMDASDDNALLIDGQPVTGIDVPNRAVTTATSVSGSAAGDYYTVADTVSSAGSLHMLGLDAWIDSANPVTVVGNIGGIDRSAAGNEWWGSTELTDTANRPFDEDLGIQAMDLTRERGGEMITDFMSNLNIIRRYHATMRADTYFALGAIGPMGKAGLGRDGEMSSGEDSKGDTPYHFSNIPWRAEMFMRANTIYGINRDHLYLGYDGNEVPRPINEVFDDMIPFFNLPSTPAAKFEVLSYWEAEMLGDSPVSHVKLTAIAES